MNKIVYFTSPGGDEMAILPRAELEALQDAADHAGALAAYRGGKVPGLTVEQTKAFVEAPSPLAFWRKFRGHTQAQLAAEIGIAQNYLSDLENGKRTGDVALWLRLAKALDLPVETLVDDAD
ncbi:helix-turn-helix transcriptional regulator [Mesorhizobium sp. LHD-90]|uniref:helix-turn-helix domain-containing protein n=1 Tax=Mesorhizobium sp. LHD-90 TaxID=3071414 RepID=UPI0027E0D05E|nr:helix-turn-helix transcriptional regulator [Mesorhizobium sp. LHD-90]MDQ6437139.1 helix-turn-helix transcriptional regulator [Mesorhizobium sp. LHD-90]